MNKQELFYSIENCLNNIPDELKDILNMPPSYYTLVIHDNADLFIKVSKERIKILKNIIEIAEQYKEM